MQGGRCRVVTVGAGSPAGRGGVRGGAQRPARLALLAEANPERTNEALDLWLRALDEEAGKGAAALARAGTRRVAARVGKDAALARAVELEAAAATGPERAAWLALAAALARHRLGAAARAVALVEEARGADPNNPALLTLSVANHLEAGQWTKARLGLDRHAELSNDKDWGATLAGFGAHLAEHHEGGRRGGGGALPAPAGGAARQSGGARGAGTHRLPHGRRARAGAAGGGRRRSQRRRGRARQRWRCAPRSWPRRRRTICRARRGWPGGRSRPCPVMRRRRTCWSGCTRRSGSGASWSRWWRCRRGRVRGRRAPDVGAAGAARDGARETSTRVRARGGAVRGAPAGPGQGAGALRRMGRAGRTAAVGAARAAARRREGGRRPGGGGSGAQAGD